MASRGHLSHRSGDPTGCTTGWCKVAQLVGLGQARGGDHVHRLGHRARVPVQCGSLAGAAHTGIGAAIASDTSYLKSYGSATMA
jgi:hypothetical protein